LITLSCYRVFTPSSKHRANVEQTSSKHRAGSSRPIGTPPLTQI